MTTLSPDLEVNSVESQHLLLKSGKNRNGGVYKDPAVRPAPPVSEFNWHVVCMNV